MAARQRIAAPPIAVHTAAFVLDLSPIKCLAAPKGATSAPCVYVKKSEHGRIGVTLDVKLPHNDEAVEVITLFRTHTGCGAADVTVRCPLVTPVTAYHTETALAVDPIVTSDTPMGPRYTLPSSVASGGVVSCAGTVRLPNIKNDASRKCSHALWSSTFLPFRMQLVGVYRSTREVAFISNVSSQFITRGKWTENSAQPLEDATFEEDDDDLAAATADQWHDVHRAVAQVLDETAGAEYAASAAAPRMPTWHSGIRRRASAMAASTSGDDDDDDGKACKPALGAAPAAKRARTDAASASVPFASLLAPSSVVSSYLASSSLSLRVGHPAFAAAGGCPPLMLMLPPVTASSAAQPPTPSSTATPASLLSAVSSPGSAATYASAASEPTFSAELNDYVESASDLMRSGNVQAAKALLHQFARSVAAGATDGASLRPPALVGLTAAAAAPAGLAAPASVAAVPLTARVAGGAGTGGDASDALKIHTPQSPAFFGVGGGTLSTDPAVPGYVTTSGVPIGRQDSLPDYMRLPIAKPSVEATLSGLSAVVRPPVFPAARSTSAATIPSASSLAGVVM